MKLVALAQRGSKKDFVDVHALGVSGLSLSEMVRWYCERFAVQETTHLLYSLVYFDDANPQRLEGLLRPANWRKVKHTMRQWVEELLAAQ